MRPERAKIEQKPVLEQDITDGLQRLNFARDMGDEEAQNTAEGEMNDALREYRDLLKSMGGTAVEASDSNRR